MKKIGHIFKIGFLLIIVGSLSVTTSYSLFMHFTSKKWVSVKAVVVNIKETSAKSSDLIYKYEFLNRTYQGDNFALLSPGTIPDKDLIESNYNVGKEIIVYINPNSPEQSVVLKRAIRIEYLWGEIVMIILFTIALIFSVKRYEKYNKSLQPTAVSGG